MKKKFIKASEIPYMTKALRKAIMKRYSETLSKFFVKAVEKLDIKEFKNISNIDGLSEPMEIVIKKYENHPSIIAITEKFMILLCALNL